jgi:hypothetical protein
MIVAAVNGKLRWDAHWEHVAHDTPREDKPEYAYQNIRTKNYFWGDGDKVRHIRYPPKPDSMTDADICRPSSGTTRSTTTRRTSKHFQRSSIGRFWAFVQIACVYSTGKAQARGAVDQQYISTVVTRCHATSPTLHSHF